MATSYDELKTRFKESIELNEDNTIATVTFKFRGLDEAESFLNFVRGVLRLSTDFIWESDEMDNFCKKNHCEEF